MIYFKKEWLNGTHLLTGIDQQQQLKRQDPDGYTEELNTVIFTIDGENYRAVEDPDDGYRSYCEDLELCDLNPIITFPAVEVIIKTKDEKDGFCGIEFIDILSKEVILRLGTDYSQWYYPMCIFEWHPEKMYTNRKRETLNTIKFADS